ncbi:hypothetical protein VNO80_26094 [Phaseolus coccineus]|uniref:Uncharacterized protein n=1 Tax=Phaseolus coccineus TaxID=3886 RepID=A0AAN9QQP5_PHACN
MSLRSAAAPFSMYEKVIRSEQVKERKEERRRIVRLRLSCYLLVIASVLINLGFKDLPLTRQGEVYGKGKVTHDPLHVDPLVDL